MCNKVLWIHRGEQIIFSDDAQSVCDDYQLFLDGAMPLEMLQEKYRFEEEYSG